jgi:hypothetical protein
MLRRWTRTLQPSIPTRRAFLLRGTAWTRSSRRRLDQAGSGGAAREKEPWCRNRGCGGLAQSDEGVGETAEHIVVSEWQRKAAKVQSAAVVIRLLTRQQQQKKNVPRRCHEKKPTTIPRSSLHTHILFLSVLRPLRNPAGELLSFLHATDCV